MWFHRSELESATSRQRWQTWDTSTLNGSLRDLSSLPWREPWWLPSWSSSSSPDTDEPDEYDSSSDAPSSTSSKSSSSSSWSRSGVQPRVKMCERSSEGSVLMMQRPSLGARKGLFGRSVAAGIIAALVQLGSHILHVCRDCHAPGMSLYAAVDKVVGCMKGVTNSLAPPRRDKCSAGN